MISFCSSLSSFMSNENSSYGMCSSICWQRLIWINVFFLNYLKKNYERWSYVKSYSSTSLLFVKQLLFCELLALGTISSKIILFCSFISFLFMYSCTYDCKLSHSS